MRKRRSSNKSSQFLVPFSLRLIYYEFTFDFKSGAVDGDVQEVAGLTDRSPQDVKNVSMTGDINHHKKTFLH